MNKNEDQKRIHGERISELLNSFSDKEISLGRLVEELEDLLDNTNSIDGTWGDELREDWWTLEQAYAASLSSDGKVMKELGEIVDVAIKTISRKILT